MPPLPTSPSSSYRPAISSPVVIPDAFPVALRLSAGSRFQSLFPDRKRLLELLVGQGEGGKDADAVRVNAGFEQKQSALCGLRHDRGCEHRRGPLGLAVLDQLDREHRAEPAHVADRRETLLP